MKKFVIGLIFILLAVGSAGYVKGFIPNTPAYKEKVQHERLMNSLKSMDNMTERINADFLKNYMTKDRAYEMRINGYDTCKKVDKDNTDDSTGKALSAMCESFIGEIVAMEIYSSNNGSIDITDEQLFIIAGAAKTTDDIVDQFIRMCDDEEAVAFVEKKFKNFSDRYR